MIDHTFSTVWIEKEIRAITLKEYERQWSWDISKYFHSTSRERLRKSKNHHN